MINLTDPRQMGLLTFGLSALGNAGGGQPVPTSFARGFGQAGQAGLLGARQAQQDALQQGLLSMQLQSMQQDMERRRAWDDAQKSAGTASSLDTYSSAAQPGMQGLQNPMGMIQEGLRLQGSPYTEDRSRGRALIQSAQAVLPFVSPDANTLFKAWSMTPKEQFDVSAKTAELADRGVAIPQAPAVPTPGAMPQTPMRGTAPTEQAAIEAVRAASSRGQPATFSVRPPAAGARLSDPYAGGVPPPPPGLAPAQQREWIANQAAAAAASQRTVAEKQATTDISSRAELEKVKPQVTLATNTAKQTISKLKESAQELKKHSGLARITGMLSKFPNVPGEPSANAQALLDTLKNQVFATALQALRDASKSGGAVGQVSEKEGTRLESMLGALDQAQSYGQFVDQLNRIIKHVDTATDNLDSAYKMQFGDAPKSNDLEGFKVLR